MDQPEQGSDQRVQQVERRKADWELIALKLQLLNPELYAALRDYSWSGTYESLDDVYRLLGVLGTCQRSTATYSISAAARRLWYRQHPYHPRIPKRRMRYGEVRKTGRS